ncbi:MAG: formate hydrogenase, partial [Leptospira sp.]|nr:formate hydrogenase [Leptospira sp.]
MRSAIYAISTVSVLLPIPLGIFLGFDFLGADLPIGIGLLIQTISANAILFYVFGYEHRNHGLIQVGYLFFFGGLSGAYLAGKTFWLLFSWEILTFGAILVYSGGIFDHKAIRSIIAIFLKSGFSLIFLTGWIFHSDAETGLLFLVCGLLIQAAFIGVHVWLPEAHSGGPAHSSAAYSGLMVNLPLLLFVRYAPIHSSSIGLAQYLIPLAAFGVFFGAITSFFQNDVKKSLAYSTIENLNFLWLILFISGYWIRNTEPRIYELGKSFMILFYFTLIFHSFSKTFQFLSFGYLCKIAKTNIVDECKGIGRISGISTLVLSPGTFNFLILPGTMGFLAEATFLFLNSKVLDLPYGRSIFVLPAIVFMMFGLVIGSAAHIRLFLPMVLSVPANETKTGIIAPFPVRFSLYFLGVSMLFSPVVVLSVFFFNESLGSWTPAFLYEWLKTLLLISSAMILFFLSLVIFRWAHRIRNRKLWDCGNKYRGAELSVPSSTFSDPLIESIGKYFNTRIGFSRIDDKVAGFFHGVL